VIEACPSRSCAIFGCTPSPIVGLRGCAANAEFGIFARMPSPGKCRVIAAWALILASFRHRACGIILVALQGVWRPQKLIGRAVTSRFAVRWRHFGERRLPKSEMNVQMNLSGCHRLMPQPERDHRTIDTYLQQLRGRTAPEPACRASNCLREFKNALVLNSSPPPSRGVGRRHRTMPHARIASPLKSRPKRQSLGIFRDSAFWRRS
jgi:hypothetical protein